MRWSGWGKPAVIIDQGDAGRQIWTPAPQDQVQRTGGHAAGKAWGLHSGIAIGDEGSCEGLRGRRDADAPVVGGKVCRGQAVGQQGSRGRVENGCDINVIADKDGGMQGLADLADLMRRCYGNQRERIQANTPASMASM